MKGAERGITVCFKRTVTGLEVVRYRSALFSADSQRIASPDVTIESFLLFDKIKVSTVKDRLIDPDYHNTQHLNRASIKCMVKILTKCDMMQAIGVRFVGIQ